MRSYAKAQPFAYRIMVAANREDEKEEEEMCEDQKDKGYKGAGSQLLKLLRKEMLIGLLLAVTVWYNSLPLSHAVDFYPLLASATVNINVADSM